MYSTVIGIKGMMCPMCEAHVNDTIRKAADVKKVKADHVKGIATVLSENPLDQEKVSAAILATGYEVTGFESSAAPERKPLFGRR